MARAQRMLDGIRGGGGRLPRVRTTAWTLALAAFVVTGSASAEEVLIEPPTAIPQTSPTVEVFPNGVALVAWTGLEIRARRVDSTGLPLGAGSFQVNTLTEGFQGYPAIAITDDGFLILWESLSGDQNAGIRAQRFNAMDQPIGSEYAVHVDTSVQERRPAISRAPDGTFVVVWTVQDDFVRGRRLDASGLPVGDELVLDTSSPFRGVSLSHNQSGDFLVAWRGGPKGVSARLFDPDGVPLGPELEMPGTQSSFSGPSSAFSGDRFLVTARSGPTDSIRGQLYDSVGGLVGEDFLISESNRWSTDAAPTPDGGFQVMWVAQDGGGVGVFTRKFSADGTPDGPPRGGNETLLGDQQEPGLAVDDTGRPILVWRGPSDPDIIWSTSGVFGRFDFGAFSDEIFTDGFESGNTASWSSETP